MTRRLDMVFDSLDQLEAYIPVLPALRVVADVMDHDDVYDKECGTYGTYDDKVSYTVSEYRTSVGGRQFEFHKGHSCVQIVLKGQELMSTTWRELKSQCDNFNEASDIGFTDAEPVTVLQATQGRFALFLPGELHKTGVAFGEPSIVKKVTFKVVD